MFHPAESLILEGEVSNGGFRAGFAGGLSFRQSFRQRDKETEEEDEEEKDYGKRIDKGTRTRREDELICTDKEPDKNPALSGDEVYTPSPRRSEG
jgi:hypothetical protein